MARYHLYVYLILGLYIIYLTSGDTHVYYHLVTEGPVCEVTQKQNHSLDLVCQFFDRPGSSNGCMVTGMLWNKVGLSSTKRITDSKKYATWEAIPGKGLADNDHVSLLRIRDFNIEDIGRYQCQIHCKKEVSSRLVHHHNADVCMQENNYAICGTHETECRSSFWNGVCDPACDNEQNLYDGFDCAPKVKPCPPMLEEYCQKAFANGICNEDCDNTECGWDGGDCISGDKQNNSTNDVVVLVIKPNLKFGEGGHHLGKLGKRFSQLFGPKTIIQVTLGDRKAIVEDNTALEGDHVDQNEQIINLSKLYLKLINYHCEFQSRCVTNVQYAAILLETAIENGWDPGIPLIKVGVLGEVRSSCHLENNTLLGIHTSPNEKRASVHPAGQMNKNSYLLGDGLLWLVIVLAVSVATLLMLLLAAIYGIRRYRKKKEKTFSYSAVASVDILRITAGKSAPNGTDV